MERKISHLVCLLVIFLFFQNAYSENVSKELTIELENKAIQLGKEWNGEKIRRSISLFNDAAKNWENLGNLKKASFCLRESAKLSFLISKEAETIPNLQKALKFDSKIKNIDGQVISHSLLLQIFYLQNDLKKTQFHIEKAIKLSDSANFYAKSYSHFIIGKHYYFSIQNKEADEFLTKALTFAEKTDDYNLLAYIHLRFGMLQATLGEKNKGLEHLNTAYGLFKKSNNKRGLVLTDIGFGFIYVITNEKQKALDLYLKAKNVIPKDIDFLEQGSLNSGIAALYSNYGNYFSAEKHFIKAVKYFEKANNLFAKLSNLSALGKIYYLTGKKLKSKKTFEKIEDLSEVTGNLILNALIYEYKGQINYLEGNFDEAIINNSKASKIYKVNGLILPKNDNLLGKAYAKKGQNKLALKAFISAERDSRLTNDSVELAESLYNLAKLNKIEGKIKLALKQIEDSISISDQLYNDVNNNGLRKQYLADTFDRYDLYVNLLMEVHNLNPQEGFDLKALKASENSRSRIMRENLRFAESNPSFDADPFLVAKEINLNRKLKFKKEELTNLLRNKNLKENTDKIKEEISTLNHELQTINASLRKNSPVYSAIRNSNDFKIRDFQNDILDENTILLEFFFGKEKSFVWLIDKTEVKVFELPKCKVLETQIDELLKLITEKPKSQNIQEYQRKRAEIEKEYWVKSKELSNSLFGQFSEKLLNKKLLIVPDGRLKYFPISALPFPNSKNYSLFLETNEIIYEPSAAMLHLLKKRPSNNVSPQKDFLIFGDAVYNIDDRLEYFINLKDSNFSKDSLFPLDNLERLRASEDEANMIFDYFDSSKSKINLGFDVNRDSFVNGNLNEYKVIHLSIHGIYNEENPTLSGLIFSQFDRKGKRQNGIVDLHDIYEMKLSADLVVLSACDTGVGKDIKGEGLMSLTNGFLQAGAKSVISSHWKVNDEATKELMRNYYQILSTEKISTSKALQKAKIKLSKNPNFKFPFYWASFTIHGDFEKVPELETKFSYSNYFYLLLIGFCVISVFIISRNKKILPKIKSRLPVI